jgi:signal transduction histidine kinase
VDAIYQIELFDGLSERELQWIVENSHELVLQPGEYWSRQGEMPTGVYITLEGELQITRVLNGERQVMGTTPRGIIGGEMWVLFGDAVQVDAVAIVPSRLLIFDVPTFQRIFGEIPLLGARILRIAMERTSGIATQVTQRQKMEALNTFSANLAHSLNNPAAAASESSRMLRGQTLPTLQRNTLALGKLGLNDTQIASLAALQSDAIRDASHWQILAPIERADREDVIGTWLENAGITTAWDIAYIFVNAGVTPDDLDALTRSMPPEHVSSILEWLASVLDTASQLNEIESSTARIAELVEGVKQYTYMDRGLSQEVHINRDLDATLRMLSGRLRDVQVNRHYDPELPPILGRGSDLNQVWTNIIENALDAMDDVGVLNITTRCENDFVMVEITDSGRGIPEAIKAHIFEPFFSTKKFAQGTTGLGLDIAYRIIKQHQGTPVVFSKPGETRFIVRLPLNSGR